MNCPKCNHNLNEHSINPRSNQKQFECDISHVQIDANGMMDIIIDIQCPECDEWFAIAEEDFKPSIVE